VARYNTDGTLETGFDTAGNTGAEGGWGAAHILP
jgi:hypothetical protein